MVSFSRLRTHSLPSILTGAIFATIAINSPAQAAEIHWLGGDAASPTNFNLGANWAGGQLPAFYDEAPNTVNGDIAVFDGTQTGVANKTPVMAAAFGNGVNQSAEWGLLGVKFVDSGWTLSTGTNTLYLSHRDTVDLRSEATSGINTLNGNVRFGARDTNDFSHIYVAAGGTLRLNANVGVAIDGGGNLNGAVEARGGGLLELNTTGVFGTSGLRVFDGTTVRFFAETAGGITGIGTGGLGTDNSRTLNIVNGTVDLNGATTTVTTGTLVVGADGVLTNGSGNPQTITTKAFSDQAIAGVISGNLSISFGANSSATATISNNNSYTGTTTVASSSGGGGTNTVVVTKDVLPNTNGPLGNASSAIILGNAGNTSTHAALLTNGAIEVGRDITLGASTNATGRKTIGAGSTQTADSTFSGTITVGTGTQSHLTVTAPANVSVRLTGSIVEHSATGDGSLTKVGLGTAQLTGDNTYAGGTTVSAGTLLANNTAGSATGTGAVTVGIDGTLGGTGRIAPTGSNGVTVAGTLAPGVSIGGLAIDLSSTTGTVSILSDAGFKFELGVAGGSIGALGSSDRLSLTGASAGVFNFSGNTIDFLGSGAQGWYKLFDTDLASGSTWSGLTLAGQSIEAGLLVTNLGAGLTGTLLVGNGANGDLDDIYLHVVPEPGTGIALLGGAAMLLGSMRRRRSV